MEVFVHHTSHSSQPQLKVRLASASLPFLNWVKTVLNNEKIATGGSVYTPKSGNVHTLSFGKVDGGKILKYMYYSNQLPCLMRKRNIADSFGRVA
jgi:hypothetical protein